MRTLSLLAGAVLALVIAGSTVAATPPAAPSAANGHPAPPVVVVHPAHKWTTAFADGNVKVRAALRASATYRGGSLTVRVAGVARGQKVTATLSIVDGAQTTVLATRSKKVHAIRGHAVVAWGLSKAALTGLRTLPAGATITLTVTTAATTATGTFTGH